MCEHEDFEAHVNVARVEPERVLPERAYVAELEVRCSQCGTRFAFQGVRHGHSWTEPTVDVIGFTLYAPMKPDAHATSMLAGDPDTAFPRHG